MHEKWYAGIIVEKPYSLIFVIPGFIEENINLLDIEKNLLNPFFMIIRIYIWQEFKVVLNITR
jgi:hypothetical protein